MDEIQNSYFNIIKNNKWKNKSFYLKSNLNMFIYSSHPSIKRVLSKYIEELYGIQLSAKFLT